jgi:hypothetical protein
MGLGDLRITPNRIVGIDASTNSLAYCIYDKQGPQKWGEIVFEGDTVYKRAINARQKVMAIKGIFADCDLVGLEPSVYVNNRNTVIAMAYVTGTIIASIGIGNVIELNPVKWQRAINNPPLTAAEKHEIKKANPGKSKSWLANEGRRIRKERTKKWALDSFGIDVDNDNITDAIAIAHTTAVETGLIESS